MRLPWKRTAREAEPPVSAFQTSAFPVSAFEALALPLLPSLYNVAFWLSRNAADAEDLVQETFLKALRGFASFEPGTNFRAWIFRILRNTYLTSTAGLAARRTVSLEDELTASEETGPAQYPEAAIDRETPETNLLHLADRAALHTAMEALPPPYLEVILLCDVEEMKYREIAMVLEIPLGTVMSRIARARSALRTLLEPENTSPLKNTSPWQTLRRERSAHDRPSV